MKAIGFYNALPIDDAESLVEIDLPEPVPGENDLLVEVRAISINPVDVKVRANSQPAPGEFRIPGWDAAGVVTGVGAKVSGFKEGDRVWYAGAMRRHGSYCQQQLVDARIASRMPDNLDFGEAASLPLTAITAWELLFDRLKVQHIDPAQPGTLLILGAAGGVGSVLTQLARELTGLTVIGTASRQVSQEWVLSHGAHFVINHSQPLRPQLEALGFTGVTHVIGLNNSESYLQQIADVLEPEGQFALIDDPRTLDIAPFKLKSLSVHWELMFTRSIFQTDSQYKQGELLNKLAKLVEQKRITPTVTKQLAGINVETIKEAHALVERGNMLGKIVLIKGDENNA
ncbi:TPA: zinc-binding alcohol dehydrogenase family protein [Klebsiella aerogenes]|nr:zinc-binding alcohol dehydrogenase family protein [Klebsiella aerogenes]HCT8623071.1 zinc-binding alcohol dehydrogenase family protein [Klebsiella aerogenes]HCT8632702.1 zinc-binding alcohol dehydrogenase family protein [Klebsiella aerogenes]HCT8713734.1 zinc-binding alcohol dehydrogenase family protein [Klebsiella aerogenes]